MTIKILAGIIGTILSVACFYPYFRDIFNHKTQPHIYTWLVWSLLQGTSVIIMIRGGAGIGVWPFVVGSLLCGCVFLLSIKYGTKNITAFDTVCLIGALLAMLVYVFLHDPLLSIILVVGIDFIGFLPTLRKSYIEPKTETASTYILSAMSSVLAVAALSNYSVITLLYPITLIVLDTACWVVIVERRT